MCINFNGYHSGGSSFLIVNDCWLLQKLFVYHRYKFSLKKKKKKKESQYMVSLPETGSDSPIGSDRDRGRDSQQEGIDFKGTFSPMSTKDSLRIIMAIVAHFDLELHQMDVRTTFLNGDLVKNVYMSEPIRFEKVSKEHMVCKLQKFIYGLKHASR